MALIARAPRPLADVIRRAAAERGECISDYITAVLAAATGSSFPPTEQPMSGDEVMPLAM